jgi:DoxX-like family
MENKEKTTMKTKRLAYWISTALIALVTVNGAVGDLTQAQWTLEPVTLLGYPSYLLTILGVWKALGVVVILAPGWLRLKEWAYAGIFFTMTGAALSHTLAGDFGPYGLHPIAPLFFALLTIVSWALRPESRTLGALSPTNVRLATVAEPKSA